MTEDPVHMVHQDLPLPLHTGERVEELHHLHHLDDSDQRLAEAIADGQHLRPRWQRDAACRGVDPSVFFPARGEPTELARALCSACPVIAECRDWALAQRDDHGVAAGMSGRQRRRLRAERKRGAT